MRYDYFVINYSDGPKQVAGVIKVSQYSNLKRFFDSVETITNEKGEKATCNCIHHANTKKIADDTATAWNSVYQADNNLFDYLPFNYYVR